MERERPDYGERPLSPEEGRVFKNITHRLESHDPGWSDSAVESAVAYTRLRRRVIRYWPVPAAALLAVSAFLASRNTQDLDSPASNSTNTTVVIENGRPHSIPVPEHATPFTGK